MHVELVTASEITMDNRYKLLNIANQKCYNDLFSLSNWRTTNRKMYFYEKKLPFLRERDSSIIIILETWRERKKTPSNNLSGIFRYLRSSLRQCKQSVSAVYISFSSKNAISQFYSLQFSITTSLPWDVHIDYYDLSHIENGIATSVVKASFTQIKKKNI